MIMKQQLAGWLQRFPVLRWGLKLAVRMFVPRHHVGAVGVVFNDAGQVLLVEHVFRPQYSWGFPGGWVERGEDPADTVRREVEEELGLKIEIRQLLLCKLQGYESKTHIPPGFGLAYYCRLVGDKATILPAPRSAYEILSIQWIDPETIEQKLTALDQKAVMLAKQEFEREQKEA
jgi:8-oxo-dGTP pyrophosphatase MutT (NUDIX family)